MAIPPNAPDADETPSDQTLPTGSQPQIWTFCAWLVTSPSELAAASNPPAWNRIHLPSRCGSSGIANVNRAAPSAVATS